MFDPIKDFFKEPFDKLIEKLGSQVYIFAVILFILGIVLIAITPPEFIPWILGAIFIVIIVAFLIYAFVENRSTKNSPEKAKPEPTEANPPPSENLPAQEEPSRPREPEASLDASEMQRAYLKAVIRDVGNLNLESIAPQAASDAKAKLSLQAVYTALLTLTPEAYEQIESGKPVERGTRYHSALEELNANRRLVLLGDPGSGKTTFVNFLALCMAGHLLESENLNLNTLTAPLPDEDGNDQDHPQPWVHGALLPIRIILRDVAARGLPSAGKTATIQHFWDFLKAELSAVNLEGYFPLLRQKMEQQETLVLFDGLDEVPEAHQRRDQILQMVEAVLKGLPKSRVLVTSRFYAYRKQDWTLNEFAAAALAPFSRGQILRFVDRWYEHLAQLGNFAKEDASGRASLLKTAIQRNERLQALAERPLLLTLMASLHAWRGGTLPEKREALYSETVDLLLYWWERRRIIRSSDGTEEMQESLAEFLKIGRDVVRQVLEAQAFNAHASQPDLQGTADIPEKELVAAFMQESPDKDIRPARLVEHLRDRAGLLVARGVGVYTFPHRTFQEYLAACHLTEDDYPDKLAELAQNDPNRWREVALLAGAKAARGTSKNIWDLAEALCCNDPPADGPKAAESDVWGAFLAGQALVETADLTRVADRHQPKLKRVQKWLVYILQKGLLTAIDRAAAGDTLAALGDPRFDESCWFLPKEEKLGFIQIPAGPFIMGSKKGDKDADDSEFGNKEPVETGEYYLAKFPVTVAQYETYLDASEQMPGDIDSLRDPPTRPVRWVSWDEAMAYCGWLTDRLRALGAARLKDAGLSEQERIFWNRLSKEGWRVSLPSEAEWEKAARGALTLDPSPSRSEGRIYPWGNDPDPNKANYDDTQIGDTSAVGCFPGGASPYGLQDMSGNLWEWTRSKWAAYPYNSGDGREETSGRESRVLRGGAFFNLRRSVRCAYRRIGPYYRYWDCGFRVGVFAP